MYLVIPLAGMTLVAVVSVLTLTISSSFTELEAANPISNALRGRDNNNNNNNNNKHPLPILDPRKLYPVEEPIPNPPLANGTETFSACMLIMDDNHRYVCLFDLFTYID